MSICRYCASLPHPYRRNAASSLVRTFASCSISAAEGVRLSKTDWSRPTPSGSNGPKKFARPENASSSGGMKKWERIPSNNSNYKNNSNGFRDNGRAEGGFGKSREGGGHWRSNDRFNDRRNDRSNDRQSGGFQNRGRSDEGQRGGFGMRKPDGGQRFGKSDGIANTSSGDAASTRSADSVRSAPRTQNIDGSSTGDDSSQRFSASTSTYGNYDLDEGLDSKRGNNRDRFNKKGSTKEWNDDGFELVRGRKPKKDVYAKSSKKAQKDDNDGFDMQAIKQSKKAAKAAKKAQEKNVLIPSSITVSRLASIFGVRLFNVQKKMNGMGMTADQQRADYMLNAEEACDIALEFGFNPTVDDEAAFDLYAEPEKEGEVHPLRPPVVTIMGHVDHGKTTLLDALRNTAVAAGEAGGITQHIGAFSVPLKSLLPADAPPTDATITFLDTPGHAAFTGMRARGASATDIVVLVVAADDGVMPQTKEVIELVKAEGDKVGLVVAINKIDKPGANVEQVRFGLLAENVYLEEDGGDVQSVKVSGLARIGLDNLVETLSTLAELRELRSRVDGKAEGVILEANIDKGMGRIATILVTRGTLRVGSAIVAGHTMCKVRHMTDHQGNAIESAGPGTPVVVSGWKETPHAGEEILEAPRGEAEAKKVVMNRIAQEERRKLLVDSEAINEKRREERERLEAEREMTLDLKAKGANVFEEKLKFAKQAEMEATQNQFKELRLIIKGDVDGTVEAVEGSLTGIGNKEAGVKIISTGVGEITESDIALAEVSGGLVIGFNVSASRDVVQQATASKVEIHLEQVIYRLIETVREKTAALLPPVIEKRTIGEATVVQNFTISTGKKTTVTIAGAKCNNGTINRKDQIRVLRGPNREEVYEGAIAKLKHLKNDVEEIRKGMECGIQLDGFEGVQPGDELITFKRLEIPRKL